MSNIYLARMWRGEEKLWKAFWLWPIVNGIILLVVTFGIHIFVIPVVDTLVFEVFWVLYTIWLTIAIWRCAKNSTPVWRVLARFLTAFMLVGGVFSFAMHFIAPELKDKDPITALEELKKDFSAPGVAPNPEASPAVSALVNKLEECGKRFDDYYREKKLDPAAYPNEKADYASKCAMETK